MGIGAGRQNPTPSWGEDEQPVGQASTPRHGDVGHAVRRRREAGELGRSELARLAGIDRSHLSRIEAGETQPGWARLGLIACALQISLSTLTRDVELDTVRVTQEPADAGRAGAPVAPSGAALGSAVRRLRQTRGASIEELAFAVGLHPTSVYKIERAQRQPIWPTVCHLARALGVSVSRLVEEAERGSETPS